MGLGLGLGLANIIESITSWRPFRRPPTKQVGNIQRSEGG